jgi:hypothetical protein
MRASADTRIREGATPVRLRSPKSAEPRFSSELRLGGIVINKLKSDPRKVSLKVKRYRCSIDRQYLLDRLRQ